MPIFDLKVNKRKNIRNNEADKKDEKRGMKVILNKNGIITFERM